MVYTDFSGNFLFIAKSELKIEIYHVPFLYSNGYSHLYSALHLLLFTYLPKNKAWYNISRRNTKSNRYYMMNAYTFISVGINICIKHLIEQCREKE